MNVLNRQESDGLRSTSPESLSIIDSYQPQTRYSLTAPSTSPPHQVIPIMKKSYFNRTVEDVHPYVPTLNDFVKVFFFVMFHLISFLFYYFISI